MIQKTLINRCLRIDSALEHERVRQMSKPFFVKFSVPKEVTDAAYEALQLANQTGSVLKGTNETTKAVERAQAKLVVIAEDVEPPEVVAHLPLICDERKILYVFVPNKQKIGSAVGIDVPAAAAAIVELGDSAPLVKEIGKRLEQVKKAGTG
jgi:large subunit ribosomal protein L7Ae